MSLSLSEEQHRAPSASSTSAVPGVNSGELATVCRARRGGSRVPALLCLLVVFAGGVMAYRHFFGRQGEAAVALIPDDAAFVVTLDLTPSPNQVTAFRRISDALHAANADKQMDDAVTGLLNNSPLAKDLRPYVSNNFAFAVFTSKANTSGVMLAAITNQGAVRDILNRDATRSTQNGLEVYQIPQAKVFLTVCGDYLVGSDKTAVLARIESTRKGETGSLARLAAYQEARAALPGDSNLMVFASPKQLVNAAVGLTGAMFGGTSQLNDAKWLAYGIALRDDGLEIQMQSPGTFGNVGAAMSQIAALDANNILKRLPSGAFGLTTISQPGRYWNPIVQAAHGDKNAGPEFDRDIASFERETGLSVANDLVPALGGTTTLAVYPGTTANPSDVNGLLLVDDAGGSNPAGLADKLRQYAERESAKSNKPVHFTSETASGATIWTVDAASETQLNRMLNGASPAGLAGAVPGVQTLPTPGTTTAGSTLHKTVVFAQMGKSLLLTSSRPLLDRALASFQTGANSLSDDPACNAMRSHLQSGAQNILLVNLPQIMQAFRPVIAKELSANSNVSLDDIMAVFGSNPTGLAASQKYDGSTIKAGVFVPLDIPRIIKMANADKPK